MTNYVLMFYHASYPSQHIYLINYILTIDFELMCIYTYHMCIILILLFSLLYIIAVFAFIFVHTMSDYFSFFEKKKYSEHCCCICFLSYLFDFFFSIL